MYRRGVCYEILLRRNNRSKKGRISSYTCGNEKYCPFTNNLKLIAVEDKRSSICKKQQKS